MQVYSSSSPTLVSKETDSHTQVGYRSSALLLELSLEHTHDTHPTAIRRPRLPELLSSSSGLRSLPRLPALLHASPLLSLPVPLARLSDAAPFRSRPAVGLPRFCGVASALTAPGGLSGLSLASALLAPDPKPSANLLKSIYPLKPISPRACEGGNGF